MTLLWVVVAGGLGSGARYLVGRWAIAAFGAAFPYGTLIVNLVGCFALGIVVQLASSGEWNPELRAAIAIGFLGGFTTYSSFNQDTIALLSSGAFGAAGWNVLMTVAGGLAAGSLGVGAARLLRYYP
jgi:fluoride exporter